VLSHSSISTDRLGSRFGLELRRVVLAVVVMFIVPTAVAVGVIEFTAWRLGLTWSAEEVAKSLIAGPNDGISLAQGLQMTVVHEEMIARLRPEILAAGTSRIAELRSAMFRPYTFYNDPMQIITWKQYKARIEHVPAGYHPRIVIFNIDPFMFHAEWAAKYSGFWTPPDRESWGWPEHLSAIRSLVQSGLERAPYLLVKPARDPFYGGRAIGLGAILDGGGYRRDGSSQYGSYYRDGYPFSGAGLSGEGVPGQPIFYAADDFDPGQKADFEEFVRDAHSRGIELIGVLLPVWGGIVDKIDKDPRMGTWRKFNNGQMENYLNSIGVHFQNCLRLPGYSTNNEYFIDGLHPTEPAILACVIKMLENPEIRTLLPEVSIDRLREKLAEDATHTSHIDLFNYEF
jgi:hypothetical protein